MTRLICVFFVGFACFAGQPGVTAAQELSGPELLSNQLLKSPVSQLVNDARKFGDPRRGAMAFYQPAMNCAKCHESNSARRRLGPDLSEKREVELEHLIESVLNPSAKIKQGFESVQVLLDDGRQLNGVLVEETDSQLVVDQIEQPELPLELAKSEIDAWKKTTLSSMPEGLANQLANRQQFLDLISYLDAIATDGPGRAAELKPTGMTALAPLPEYEQRVDHVGLIESLDDEAYQRGEETYRLRCASCHGTLEEEGSMPTSLRFATGKFKNGNDPLSMYRTLTHGFGMMNPQRWMVPQQKHEVIHYIRQKFLKRNPSQWFDVSKGYLAALPKGDTRGPKPIVSRPWTLMDYGPSLINTIEVSRDGSNIAQKGIAVRLDDGPGGVESGKYWMMYEHDTMRVAGAWSDGFIDYEGIHFNGTHGRHPRVAGNIHFSNPTGPGWGRPSDGSFTDQRVVGRDDKRYGPLDRDWAHYKGMYRFGRQSIINYTVGDTEILETPRLEFVDGQPVFQRQINLGQRDKELVLQVAKIKNGKLNQLMSEQSVAVLLGNETAHSSSESDAIELDGSTFGEINNGDAFDLSGTDYSIACRIKTRKGGTIFAQTQAQNQWTANGKTLFVKGGRLTFDIGWVGAVRSNRRINDGKWHDVAMTWRASDGQVQFSVDGKPAGGGKLQPQAKLEKPVVRIGFTNDNFPSDPFFEGAIADLRFFQRRLSDDELAEPDKIKPDGVIGSWSRRVGSKIPEDSGKELVAAVSGSTKRRDSATGLLASVTLDAASWEFDEDNLRLRIPAGKPINIVVSHCPVENLDQAANLETQVSQIASPSDLSPLTKGGPPNWSKKLTTEMIRGNEEGPFAVDVLTRPVRNPWNAQLRLTGLDFLPDGNTMVVSAWDGSVWKVSGFGSDDATQLTWQRVAAGLFQPLGIKWIDGRIYVTCRDQLAVLHDFNGDGEMDWYQSLNSDHQVTEHFHEFAMGLQTDDEGNFYYAKSARHAKTALVPHHGTLLKITPDGERTEILATGFRAANGVCINPDGSFLVTDQEGHWNPKNRINWVRPGEFYGNMFGYHDVSDESDEAMSDPLCWITNAFDRSPSELLWVTSKKWGPLSGSLLNFSYGYGEIYVVPHEEVDGKMQGGMCAFPIERFPTGVMRGRFHPTDGQLYCCGMFAWAGSQQQPGGLYRVRYTGKPVHLPVGLSAYNDGVEIRFAGLVDRDSAIDPSNYSVNTWDLKRTANYGSKHYNEQRLEVASVTLLPDGKTVKLEVPEIKTTWGMEINYSIQTDSGKKLQGKIHNSIYRLKD